MSTTTNWKDKLMAERVLIRTDEGALDILQKQKVIPRVLYCSGKSGRDCGGVMRVHVRRKGKRRVRQFRCGHAKCRKEYSILSTSSFFSGACLSLSNILEIVHMWTYGRYTIREAALVSNHSQTSIVKYWVICRKVCTLIMDAQPKYVGTAEQPVQVDESFFHGRRKYGRGRLQSGDRKKNESDDFEFEDWASVAASGVHIYDGPKFQEDVDSWEWVVGTSESKHKVRFIRVQERDQYTLKAVLEKYIQEGSYVWTDCWLGYSKLTMSTFRHAKVNHKDNFVDPETGVNTQRIERAWRIAKCWYRRANGNRRYLQSHLDEAAYRKLRSSDSTGRTLFELLLNDIRVVLPGTFG